MGSKAPNPAPTDGEKPPASPAPPPRWAPSVPDAAIEIRHLNRKIRQLKDDADTWHKAMCETDEQLGKALTLLRRLEWAPEDDEYSGKNVCGICGNVEEEEHKPGCELAKFLRENEEGK